MADAMDWHYATPPEQTRLFFQPIVTSTPNPAPNRVAPPPTSRLFDRFRIPPKPTSPENHVSGEWPGSPGTIKRRYSEIDPEPEPYWWRGEGGQFYEAGPVTKAGKVLWATAEIAKDRAPHLPRFIYNDVQVASRFVKEKGKEWGPPLAEVAYDAASAAGAVAYLGTKVVGHHSYKRIKIAARGVYGGSQIAGRGVCQASQVAGAYGAYAGDRFIVQPIIEIVRRHIATRRANRRRYRQQNPLPQLSQSPLRRALNTRQGQRVAPKEPIETVQPTSPTPPDTSNPPIQVKTPWQIATTTFSDTPEVDDEDEDEEHPQIRTSAGPTKRRLFVRKPAKVEPGPRRRSHPKPVTRPKQLIHNLRKNANKLQRDRHAYKSKYRQDHPVNENQEPTTAPIQELTDATNSTASQHQVQDPAPQPFVNQLANVPRLSPPEEAPTMRSKTPAQANVHHHPPPCPILKTPFPQMDPLIPEQPDLPSAPDSPGTQLMQELNQATRDESDSDVSSTLDIAWIPRRRLYKQTATLKDSPSTPIQTSGTEPNVTEKTPQTSSPAPVQTSETKPEADGKTPHTLPPTTPMPTPAQLTREQNGAIQTPQSRQGRFRGRSYLDVSYSDISSTCDISPGPTPELPIVISDDAPEIPVVISDDVPELPIVVSDDSNTSPLEKKSTSAQSQTPTSPQEQTPTLNRVQTRSSTRVSAENTVVTPAQVKTPASGSGTTEVTAAPTPSLSTLSVLEQSVTKPKNVHALTPEQVVTPKAKRHSAEKTGRVTRAQKKAQDAKDDVARYILAPLTADQLASVNQAIRRGHGKLSATDLARVVPHAGTSTSGTAAWLNDETINEYLQLVVAHGKLLVAQKGAAPTHHAFNSFFFSNLDSKGPEAVKRWAQRAKLHGNNLLQAKFVFIPINFGSHWTLCVVSGVNKTITHYNSLPGDGRRHLRVVTSWVKAELGSLFVEEEWTVGSGQSPQQENSDDCGVFTVTNARQLMLGVVPGFGAEDIPLQRSRMVAELVAEELLKAEGVGEGDGEED